VEHGLWVEIRRLREALEVYANPESWVPVFEEGKHEMRMWVGPGEGSALAKLALVKEVPEEPALRQGQDDKVSDEPNAD